MPKIQTPLEFLHDFYQLAQEAEYRIFIQSMNFEYGDVLGQIAPILIQKSKSGVDVRLYIDWVASRYVHEKLTFFPSLNKEIRDYQKALLAKTQSIVRELTEAGVKFVQINRPSPLQIIVPIVGRNHKKMYVVDSTAAWVGGVNFADHAFHNVDCMIKLDEPQFVETVASQFYNDKMQQRKDLVEKLSDNFQLVIDGGRRRSSMIYDTALAMARSGEKSIVFASQFLPDGPLLDLLIQKHLQQVKIIILTSPATTAGFHKLPYKFTYLKCKKIIEDHGIKIHYLTKKVHAKVLFVDNQQVIIGSHNLVKFGVDLGTQEIALWSNEKAFITNFRSFLYQNVFKYQEDLFFGDSLPFFI